MGRAVSSYRASLCAARLAFLAWATVRPKGRWHRGDVPRASHDSALTADTVTRLGLAPVGGVAAWRGVVGLQARQVAGVTVAGEMNERFGGEHTNLTSAPLRHDLVVLPPDALAVLAAMREQGGLFLFDHCRDVHVGVRQKAFRL